MTGKHSVVFLITILVSEYNRRRKIRYLDLFKSQGTYLYLGLEGRSGKRAVRRAYLPVAGTRFT